jgi:hypothetical protein
MSTPTLVTESPLATDYRAAVLREQQLTARIKERTELYHRLPREFVVLAHERDLLLYKLDDMRKRHPELERQ